MFFARVPLVSWANSIPAVADFFFFGLALLATWAIALCTQRRIRNISLLAFVLAAALLAITNQHRLQPWFYQFAILCTFAGVLSTPTFLRFARMLLVSTYLFSAWSKLDYTFLHSLGQQFIDTILSPLGALNEQLNPSTRIALALAFPLGELLVGVGLWWPPTRRIAAKFAIGLHVALIGVLGPWGLGHSLGVLIWNAHFIAMIAILYLGKKEDAINETPESQPSPKWVRYACTAVLLLPMLEPLGWIDHWPAWQVYAPRNSRAALQIVGQPPDSLKNVPRSLLPFIKSDDAALYAYVDLNAWSLDRLGVPIYPQDRFQLGVAIDVANRCKLEGAVKLTLEQTAHRFTGKRSRETLRGTAELQKAAGKYRLNAIPSRK